MSFSNGCPEIFPGLYSCFHQNIERSVTVEQLCPRCNQNNVTRSSTSAAVGRSAGLVGLLIANAAASYNCTSCGKIPLAEFPEEFQAAVKRKRLFSVLGAIGIFLAVIVLLFFMQSM